MCYRFGQKAKLCALLDECIRLTGLAVFCCIFFFFDFDFDCNRLFTASTILTNRSIQWSMPQHQVRAITHNDRSNVEWCLAFTPFSHFKIRSGRILTEWLTWKSFRFFKWKLEHLLLSTVIFKRYLICSLLYTLTHQHTHTRNIFWWIFFWFDRITSFNRQLRVLSRCFFFFN